MYGKIQGGGGGRYSNSGSSSNAAEYLENGSNPEDGISPFFNHRSETIATLDVIKSLDSNKAKLCRDEAKFFVMTLSPSQDEILNMGNTVEDRKREFRNFIKNEVMDLYAENFNKGLTKEDIMYYAILHEKRGRKPGEQLHAHILISRKCTSNKMKLSPQTNHSKTIVGPVKGGFNRVSFYQLVESKFDKKFKYERKLEDFFEYKNSYKKGDWQGLTNAIKKGISSENRNLSGNELFASKENQLQENKQSLQKSNKERGGGYELSLKLGD